MAALPADQAALDAMIQAAVDAAVLQANAANAANLANAAVPGANAAVAGVAGVGVAAPVVAPAPHFALNPAGGGGNVPWDFSTGQGTRMFIAATAAIEPIYDGAVDGLNAFLRRIWHRADAFGFTGILMVVDSNFVARNLTREFGCLTTANMRAAALVYLRVQERRQQAAELLRLLILASILPTLADRLFYRRAGYCIDVAQPGVAAAADF
jgi:hypothetical protein